MSRDDDLIGTVDEANDVECETLYELFCKHLPNHRSERSKNQLDFKKLAEDLEISNKAIYAWMKHNDNKGTVSTLRIVRLTQLEGSTLTWENLSPFLPNK